VLVIAALVAAVIALQRRRRRLDAQLRPHAYTPDVLQTQDRQGRGGNGSGPAHTESAWIASAVPPAGADEQGFGAHGYRYASTGSDILLLGPDEKGGGRAASDAGDGMVSRNGAEVLVLGPRVEMEVVRPGRHLLTPSPFSGASPSASPSPSPSPAPVPRHVRDDLQLERHPYARDSTWSPLPSPTSHYSEQDRPDLYRAPTFLTLDSEESHDRTPPTPLPRYTPRSRPLPDIPFMKAL